MTLRRLETPIRFLAVGVANTLVGLLCIYSFKWLLGAGDAAANISGYSIGLTLGFILNRGWTFQHKGAPGPALVRFLAVFAVAYPLNLATVLVTIDIVDVNSYLAHAIGIVPYTIVFFLGSRYFAFPRSGRSLV